MRRAASENTRSLPRVLVERLLEGREEFLHEQVGLRQMHIPDRPAQRFLGRKELPVAGFSLLDALDDRAELIRRLNERQQRRVAGRAARKKRRVIAAQSSGSIESRRPAASDSTSPYARRISGLWYLTGVGRSPVMISVASWKSPRTAARSASHGRPKRRVRSSASAWAITATSSECSAIFSLWVLRISPHRLMYFMRESMAKNCSIRLPVLSLFPFIVADAPELFNKNSLKNKNCL